MSLRAGAFIIDDHNLFSGGMMELVLGLEGIFDAACFPTPAAALEFEPDFEVRIIVTDYYIPGYDMSDWIGRFRNEFPGVPIAVVSSSISRADRSACLDAGARAYFEKHQPPEDVLTGFQKLLQDEEVGDASASPVPEADVLTDRQIDILVQLARGMSTKEIARLFGLSPETIKTHVSAIYRRLNVSGKAGAADWARKHGVI